jgi:hypothetical protein
MEIDDMSLKYGTETHKIGKYTLIEKTSFEKSKCIVKLNGMKIAEYGSLRMAIYRKAEWYEV